MDEEKKIPKRIIFDVPEELHSKVKSEAALRNIPIRKWIIRLIINELTRLESYK